MDNEKNATGIFGARVGKAAILALVILSVFLLAKSINELKSYAVIGKGVVSSNTITVSGKGEVVKQPDIATFSFSVSAESLDVAEAQSKSAKSINDITDYLTKNGVEKTDIKTTGYNIYPRYEWQDASYGVVYRPGKQVLAAYVVTQTNEVKIRTLADAGKIIGGLGDLGATDISGLTFGFDKEEIVKSEARKAAIDQAKQNAEDIASGLGVSLGRVVNFSENSYNPPIAYPMAAAGAMKMDAASVPDITPGENKVTSNVTITYELK